MKNILVSLISDQTIPNIEFIKEKPNVDAYLFLTTKGMEKKGCREWILNVTKIDEEKLLPPLIIDAFSFEDIESKLEKIISSNDRFIVNLTGGTKIMSLATYEFFKDFSSEIFYLTGQGEYIKIHPGRRKETFSLNSKVDLHEYLTAYGFEIKDKSLPIRDSNETKKILDYFLHQFDNEKDIPVLEELRNRRSKKNTSFEVIDGLEGFLNRLGFVPEKNGKLSKYESQYLTGDWLEEYLYFFLIDNFGINEDDIGLSWIVEKNGSTNEFDVLLMRNNKLYLFECKTSVFKDANETQTFISDTIYKSDSLRNKFGLFTQTTVFTLSALDSDKLRPHLERAEASKVKIIEKESFLNENLYEALKNI